jgi:hypothetical protein
MYIELKKATCVHVFGCACVWVNVYYTCVMCVCMCVFVYVCMYIYYVHILSSRRPTLRVSSLFIYVYTHTCTTVICILRGRENFFLGVKFHFSLNIAWKTTCTQNIQFRKWKKNPKTKTNVAESKQREWKKFLLFFKIKVLGI